MSQGNSPIRWIAGISFLLAATLPCSADLPDGNAQILGGTNDSTIVITTTRRLAGAIDSLKWNGHEFINSADHGRQLQSACSFDNMWDAGAETRSEERRVGKECRSR